MQQLGIEPWNIDNIDNYLIVDHQSQNSYQHQLQQHNIKSNLSITNNQHKVQEKPKRKKIKSYLMIDKSIQTQEDETKKKELGILLQKELTRNSKTINQKKLKSFSSIEKVSNKYFINPITFNQNPLINPKLLRIQKIQQQFKNQIKSSNKEYNYNKKQMTDISVNYYGIEQLSYRNNYSYLVELKERKRNKEIREEFKLQQQSLQLSQNVDQLPKYPKLPKITPNSQKIY